MKEVIQSAVWNIAVALHFEFARMFAENVYIYRFDTNYMNTIHFILQTRLFNMCALAHG